MKNRLGLKRDFSFARTSRGEADNSLSGTGHRQSVPDINQIVGKDA